MGTTAIGRPSSYRPEIADFICAEIASGKSIRQIMQQDGTPSIQTVFTWLRIHPCFLEQYTRAREMQAELMADEIVDLADDASNDVLDGVPNTAAVQRSRLQVEARKWVAAKLLPKKYGDKLDVTHGVDSSLADILAKARKRTTKRRKLKELPVETIPDAEIIETAAESTPHTVADGVAGVE